MTSLPPDEREQRKVVEQHPRELAQRALDVLADLVASDNHEATELVKKYGLATELELRLGDHDEI